MERILTDTREMLLFYNHRLKPLDVNVMHIFERRTLKLQKSHPKILRRNMKLLFINKYEK